MNAASRERTLRIVYGALVASELSARELSDSGKELVHGGELARLLGELLVRLGAELAPTRVDSPDKRETPPKAGARKAPAKPRAPKASAKPRAPRAPKPESGPDPFVALIDARAARKTGE